LTPGGWGRGWGRENPLLKLLVGIFFLPMPI
jgi:hypothetical protein